MYTKTFWLETLERALKTFAQTTVASLPLATAAVTMTLATFWPVFLAAAGTGVAAAIISLLTSLASTMVGNKNSPSLVTNRGKHELR